MLGTNERRDGTLMLTFDLKVSEVGRSPWSPLWAGSEE